MKWTWIERALVVGLGLLMVVVLAAWWVPPARADEFPGDESACDWTYITTVHEFRSQIIALEADHAAELARRDAKEARQAETIARLRAKLRALR